MIKLNTKVYYDGIEWEVYQVQFRKIKNEVLYALRRVDERTKNTVIKGIFNKTELLAENPDLKDIKYKFEEVFEFLVTLHGEALGDTMSYRVHTEAGDEVAYVDCGETYEDFSKVSQTELMNAIVTELEFTDNFYGDEHDDPDAVIKPGINITIKVEKNEK